MTSHWHHERPKALVLLLAIAVLWSFGGVLIKCVDWNPFAIAGVRSVLTLPVLLLMLRRSHLTFSADQIAGAVFYGVNLIMFVTATKMTTAANAILLQYTAPVYVALFSSWLLQEPISRLDWTIVFVALFGVALFFFDDLSLDSLWGTIIAAIGGVTFAFMILFMRRQKSSFPLGSIFLGNILTAILCLPFMFEKAPGAMGWTCLVLLGTIQLGLPCLLYAIAIRHVSGFEASIVPILEPVLNPLWMVLFLGETPGRWALAGGTIVIGAVLARSLIALRP